MIINPSAELEDFIVSGSAESTPELLRLLEERQIPFEETSGRLVLDASLEILEEEQILAEMPDVIRAAAHPRFEIHRDIDSTNEQVLKFLEPGQLYICLAERQRAGRGRRGRRWVSPFGRNVYLTIGRYMKGPMSALEGLSLVVGMQAVDVLRELGLRGVGLKWPNDLVLEDGKVGGILVELKSQEDQGIGVVIGTGINLAISVHDAELIDQSWSAVSSNTAISRNVLAGRFAARLAEAVDEFDRYGFNPFVEKWQDYNLYAGQPVKIIRGAEEVTGLDRGIDEYGNLLLETDAGLQVHNSGEVSLRTVSQS